MEDCPKQNPRLKTKILKKEVITLLNAETLKDTQVEIQPGKWVAARPMLGSLNSRIKDAWQVVIGKADAVKFIKQ